MGLPERESGRADWRPSRHTHRSAQRARGTFRTAGLMGTAAAGAGAALAAAAASVCCVGPVVAPIVVAILGVGGAAWAAGLKPYSFYILAGSLPLLAYSFWSVYRERPSCAVVERRAHRGVATPFVKGVIWVAALLWVVSLSLNILLR